jgi:cobalt/nickel transport system ATP-binding protein
LLHPRIKHLDGNPDVNTDNCAIEVRDLCYRYPDGTLALAGVNLRVAPGERVALLGPNGAGKSTLIGHLNGILPAQRGQVIFDGQGVTAGTLARLRQAVGVVFQDPDNMLFMTHIADDVAFGPRNQGLGEREVAQRVESALTLVDLRELADKPGLHLSFGQKKRAALAAVLALAPRVLVLDEPTSNLDPRSKRAMIALLLGLDATLIIATHDMDLAWTLCPRAVVLDGGRVVADGAAGDIMVDGALMHRHGLEVPHLALHRLAGQAPSPYNRHDPHQHPGGVSMSTQSFPSPDLAARIRETLPAWRLDNGYLCREIRTVDWRESMEIANWISELAEAADHHPDLFIAWGQVGIRLISHDRDAVTDRDLALAEGIEGRLAS